jgi:hypothetical protein
MAAIGVIKAIEGYRRRGVFQPTAIYADRGLYRRKRIRRWRWLASAITLWHGIRRSSQWLRLAGAANRRRIRRIMFCGCGGVAYEMAWRIVAAANAKAAGCMEPVSAKISAAK